MATVSELINRLSLRHKMVISSTLVAGIILIISGLLSTGLVTAKLTQDLNLRLVTEARDVSRSISVVDGKLVTSSFIEWEEEHHTSEDGSPIYLCLVNNRHDLVRLSHNAIDKNIPLQQFTYFDSKPAQNTVVLEGLRWQFITSPYLVNGSLYGWVITGKSFERIRHIQSVLLTMFGAVLPIALLLTVVGSNVLAKRALLPIGRISRTARQIHPLNFRQRLPVPATRDEVAHLALTINEMLDRLEESILTVRQFSANASHEMKTPLAVIRVQLEMISAHIPEDCRTKEMLPVNAELDYMVKIIDDLSILAKVDTGQMQINTETVWFNDLIHEQINRFEKLALDKGIRIERSDLPSVAIAGDHQWMGVMISNLLDNAVKYSPPDTEIRVGARMMGTGRIEFWIADEGPGIPADEIAQITQRFYRSKRDADVPGCGLGLAIVKWIVAAHDGSLAFDGPASGGLRVRISLPCA